MNEIVISTSSRELADAFESVELESVRKYRKLQKADWGTPFHIAVNIAESLATKLLAKWLWEAIKKYRPDKTKIEGRECPRSEAEIADMIEKIVEEYKRGGPNGEQQ